MKIRKLKMNAFGPFKDYNEINFEPLNMKQIFLISGPTGSGKTTIFDAISFVLFGNASGEGRSDIENLRSDFADPHEETYVECEFIVNNKTYLIRRYPIQQRLKHNSEIEYTRVPSKVELEEEGEDTVLTKISDVKEKIQEILGITYDQFKQIVMLPQGEFKKLLLADSKDKTEIFRNIFQTHFYKTVQESLKEISDELNKEISLKKEHLNIYFKQIVTENDSALNILLNKDYTDTKAILDELDNENQSLKQKIELLKTKENALSKNIEQKSRELASIEHINQLIEDKQKYTDELSTLSRKSELMDTKQKEINYIKKAKDVYKYESIFLDYANQLKKIEAKNKLIKERLIDLNSKFEKVKQDYDKTPKFKDEFQENRDKIELFKADKVLTEQLNKKTNRINKLTRSNHAIKSKLRETNNQLDLAKKESAKLKAEKSELEKNIFSTSDVKVRLSEKETLINRYETLLNKIKGYSLSVDNHNGEKELFDRFKKTFKNKQNEFRKIKKQYYESQAAILAQELKTNMPCPVCGSTKHPKKASKKHLTTKSQYEKKEKDFNELKREYDQKEATLKANDKQLSTEKKVMVQQCKKLNLVFDELIMDTLNSKLEEAKKIKNTLEKKLLHAKKLNISLEDIKEKIKENESLKNKLIKDKEQLSSEFASQTGEINTLKKDVKDLSEKKKTKRSSAEISKRIRRLSERNNELENTIKSTTKLYNKMHSEKTSTEQLLESNKNDFNDKHKELADKKSKFETHLLKHFENNKEYYDFKNRLKQIEVLEKEVKEYDQNISSLKSSIKTIEKQIKGKKYTVPSPIEALIKDKKQAMKDQRDKRGDMEQTYKHNLKAFNNIESIFEEFGVLENKAEEAQMLADLARGKTANKISFENYVLAYFFSQIIEVANMKLSKMTNERYLLARKEEKSKGGGQQGLDLVVYDAYTSKTRDVSTLSGGETFKASLSLALGLAEVIQQNSGGVSLETMFIDEGFGTLDPDSLDMAIEELMNINEHGRIVGVISHVQELKNRIEVTVELEITNNGSKILTE